MRVRLQSYAHEPKGTWDLSHRDTSSFILEWTTALAVKSQIFKNFQSLQLALRDNAKSAKSLPGKINLPF